MTDLIRRADAVKTVIRKCSPICAWQVGTQQYPDSVVAEINALPSADAVQGWNNHEVACMLAELFGDACACNYNGIDEWLPLVCDLKDSCPNIVGVACWEQFLKHYERRKP